MSEEILKALMQLFAIIAKQDVGLATSERDYVLIFLKQQVNDSSVQEYIELFDKKVGLNKRKKDDSEDGKTKKRKLTSVRDSVKILGLSKKINKTLTQKQKVVVLIRLLEFVEADRMFTEQRMSIINTIAEVFNIRYNEVKDIEDFVIEQDTQKLDSENFLIISQQNNTENKTKHILNEQINGKIRILKTPSTDLYFFKYEGLSDIFLNGLQVSNKRIHILSPGSSLRLSTGKPFFYTDIVSKFFNDKDTINLSFVANNIEYKFSNGEIGLHNISLSETQGKLVGIMGSSGAGKTTLLNVLSGLFKPSSGQVLINGIDLIKDTDKLKGAIGYIPQDDLLIEELTVFENLYYNAKLCFKEKSNQEISELVDKTLTNLGLYQRKDLKVGSPLNKLISGGQRKRLNIALELIREPAILFVDEPTSGLSSRDSENIMSLMRELTLKGKLIFVVIHQPSSEIYKMFDNVAILDTGGYLIYYGNPIETVLYFKQLDAQINSQVGECSVCGNVNPEQVFNIVEAQIVDEYGQYTGVRKVTPEKWEKKYKELIIPEEIEVVNKKPKITLKVPNWFKQLSIYTVRDVKSKISNKQYLLLNLLESPILAFILAYIIRYIANPNSKLYIFRENENIAPYIFMSIVVALFIGLTVSAEEIFRDRKIIKRERFLNLSRSSYLMSKVIILFVLSAVQTFLFVIISNYILGIEGLNFSYWIALFSVALFANMLGLNISSAFNSAVTIYILIPLVLIPQMILGGAMFSFDKLNRDIVSVDKVPIVAEMMTSMWIYEALMVRQFKDNKFEKLLYESEKAESNANFKQVYYVPELRQRLEFCFDSLNSKNDTVKKDVKLNLSLLRKELKKDKFRSDKINIDFVNKLTLDSLNGYYAFMAKDYLNEMLSYYSNLFNNANGKKQRIIDYWLEKNPKKYNNQKNKYHNQSISEIVRKVFEKNKIVQYKDNLIQQVDPIFLDPQPTWYFNFRTHLFAPRKYFAGHFIDTFWFNIFVVWSMIIFLYITLYFDLLKKLLNSFKNNYLKKIFSNKHIS